MMHFKNFDPNINYTAIFSGLEMIDTPITIKQVNRNIRKYEKTFQ